jgi:hypothetical protein
LSCRFGVKTRQRHSITAFLRRLEKKACPDQGMAGITHVMVGDANFSVSQKGSKPSIGPKALRQVLTNRYKRREGKVWTTRVVPVDEFYTSQRCGECGGPLEDVELVKKRRTMGRPGKKSAGKEWKRHRVWQKRPQAYDKQPHAVRGLKSCSTKSCGPRAYRLYSRDGGSCKCIAHAGWAQVTGQPRPAQLQRPPHISVVSPKVKNPR